MYGETNHLFFCVMKGCVKRKTFLKFSASNTIFLDKDSLCPQKQLPKEK